MTKPNMVRLTYEEWYPVATEVYSEYSGREYDIPASLMERHREALEKFVLYDAEILARMRDQDEKRHPDRHAGGSERVMSEGEAAERETWSRCTKTWFGVCNDGRMEPWRGGDGHGGSEWFYTCDRCGITA